MAMKPIMGLLFLISDASKLTRSDHPIESTQPH